MRNLVFTIFLMSVFSVHQVNAEYDFDQFTSEWSAPLTSEEAKPVLYYGSGLTAFLIVFRDGIVEPFQDDFSEREPMGHLAVFGDYMGQLIPNVLYMGGMYWDYKSNKNLKSLSRSYLMLKTTFYSGLTTGILKRVVNQRRPHKDDRLSFPSGHTTTAFAFASVVGMEHELPWAIGAYSIATIVAFSRINDNAHYLHDVVFGATIGTAYGVAFYYLQQQNQTTNYQQDFNLIPVDDGLFANYSFSY